MTYIIPWPVIDGVIAMRRYLSILLTALLAGRVALAAPPGATVPDYHGDPAHSGHAVIAGLSWTQAAATTRDSGFDGSVRGHVNAQPLY